jgi:hypothetical protein
MNPAAPRQFTPTAGLAGAGLPGAQRIGAAPGNAFRALQYTCLHALHDAPAADWLRALVLQAEEPLDLWLLRGAMFAALDGVAPAQRERRQALRRGLDSAFPELDTASGFASL